LLASIAAVAVVFALAYADSRREQARALDDFIGEQSALARTAALAAGSRLAQENIHADTDASDIDGVLGPVVAAALASDAPSRALWLDDRGRWLMLASREGIGQVQWQAAEALQPELRALSIDARGRGGARLVSREASASLGLGARMAVVGFAPVTVQGRTFTLWCVTSARRVRDRARFGGVRLAIATGLAGFLVALFDYFMRRQQRREQALAHALQVAEATQAMQGQLVRAEKLATIGTLAAGVAHEVGTPLGIISGRAEMILDAASPDDPARKDLQSIIAQVDKVSQTIRQLLDFARVRPIEAGPVNAGDVVTGSAALLEHRFRQSKVKLAVQIDPHVPRVTADAGQLEQVLVNLLINACDACASGGTVRVSVEARGDQVAICVHDDGAGIAADHLPQVLDPFFTTKKRGQGTGLGLTIAADIVKNHQGSIEIASAEGKGTTVLVLLPTERGS
jgi:signal transduction histidine kinase